MGELVRGVQVVRVFLWKEKRFPAERNYGLLMMRSSFLGKRCFLFVRRFPLDEASITILL